VSHLLQNGTVLDRLSVVYSSWYHTPVVMRVANAQTRKLKTELHCTITGESEAAVHIQIGQRERNICKTMILAVEELPEPRPRQ
jgi:hypothetical protein